MITKRASRWAVAALLAVTGVATAAVRNDPGLNAYQKFNSGPPTANSEPAAKPRPKAPDADAKKSETAAALRAQEEANLLRRLAVCDRLKQIAMEQGDSRLEEEAIRLEARATEVYQLRTQHLPTAKKPKPTVREDQP